MGLIIKDKIRELMVGYPTVGDKYNITGGILSGTSPVKFGDLVMFDGGYYKKVASASSVSKIAGFVLATNVKLAKGFGDNEVLVNPGEAFNLVLGGSLLAVEINHVGEGDLAILPRGKVYVDLSDGQLYDDDDSGAYVELPGVELTGTYELQGEDIVVEILVK